jgi:DNA-binding PadR family transcriptional regulator
LARTPYKSTSCRFHSFVVYFSNLQRLGWVEPTGSEEPSAFQDHYPPGPPRRYFRLTDAGKAASEAAWLNPRLALYGKS